MTETLTFWVCLTTAFAIITITLKNDGSFVLFLLCSLLSAANLGAKCVRKELAAADGE